MPEKAPSPRRAAYLRTVRREKRRVRIWQIVLVVGLFSVWELSCRLGLSDGFLVSSPSRMVQTLWRLCASGELWHHAAVSIGETVLGFTAGTVLGTASNEECRIDSIAQSWAVLSAAGDPGRARQAMQSVNEHLVRRDDALVQLLDPPFDRSSLNPGYIRGYLPGVRENGGQYTHAAIWATMAFAELGDRERAWELFRMINPVNHALSAGAVATFKVEPYVVSADVYARKPHVGRGGWSWYTGSAGWMYRLIVESLLGLRLEGESLHFEPCLPGDWSALTIHYRYRATVYHIAVTQTQGTQGRIGVLSLSLDGVDQADLAIRLVDDRQEHQVALVINA